MLRLIDIDSQLAYFKCNIRAFDIINELNLNNSSKSTLMEFYAAIFDFQLLHGWIRKYIHLHLYMFLDPGNQRIADEIFKLSCLQAEIRPMWVWRFMAAIFVFQLLIAYDTIGNSVSVLHDPENEFTLCSRWNFSVILSCSRYACKYACSPADGACCILIRSRDKFQIQPEVHTSKTSVLNQLL